MIRNFFKLALRNIGRKKLYTVINIVGLGVASAFCILVYWYLQNERSFDRFHPQVNRLYRVETSGAWGEAKKTEKHLSSFFVKGADENNTIQTPPILAGELKKSLPEIGNAVRIQPGYETIVRVNNQSFDEKENTAFVDLDFFTIFGFPLKQGNAAIVLASRHAVVLSETAAKKYFGNEEAVGKTLVLPNMNNLLLTVSGVAKDFPQASSLHYDLIMPREAIPDYDEQMGQGLNTASDLLILKLKPTVNNIAFAQKLDAFGRVYYAPHLKEMAAFPGSEAKSENFHLLMRPFAEAHYNVSQGWGHYTDLKNLFQLACLALVILVIACVNYILLSLTGAVSRSQEVGIRKTVGAERRQIVLQFYTETQLLAFLAVSVGFVLAVVCLPLFNNLTGTTFALRDFSITHVTVALLVLAVMLGVLAGVYPALIMSGLRPLNMMQKNATYRLNPYLSKILIVVQFTVCIVLIVSSLVIGKQMRYMNAAKLGFDTDQIVSIQSPYGFDDTQSPRLLKERLQQFAQGEAAIAGFTTSRFPFQQYNTNRHSIRGEKTDIKDLDVDYNYFSFYNIPILKGRTFDPTIASDSTELKLTEVQQIPGVSSARQPVVINETLYHLLGDPELNVFNRDLGSVILGVCKDYHTDDMTQKIAPTYHRIERKYIWWYCFKIKKGQNVAQLMERLKTTWNGFTGNGPFAYTFLDENVAKSYEAYRRWMQTVAASCLLAILIACLGLFGLSGITTVNRTKEIGIRKVLGASVADLFLLLNKNTLLMALLSFIVAIPIALYLVNAWLQNFAYRITIGWPLFLLAGALSLLTALLAVSYHTIKTAKANPVNSLRTE